MSPARWVAPSTQVAVCEIGLRAAGSPVGISMDMSVWNAPAAAGLLTRATRRLDPSFGTVSGATATKL